MTNMCPDELDCDKIYVPGRTVEHSNKEVKFFLKKDNI